MSGLEDIGNITEEIEDDEKNESNAITEIKESYCMACEESNGVTRLMLTKIPYFREVILSSFECQSCGERNTEVQFGGEIAERGCRYQLKCQDAEDLNRRVIKSDSGVIRLPQLELEIPTNAQKGTISTVEGVLKRTADDLEVLQPARRQIDQETASKIQTVIDALRDYAQGDSFPFDVHLEDPSGNSYVERKVLGTDQSQDTQLIFTTFERSPQQNIALGLYEDGMAPIENAQPLEEREHIKPRKQEKHTQLNALDFPSQDTDSLELIQFAVDCPHCKHPGTERMCTAHVPHFKECIIMSFVCEKCGFKNSEIKAGGAIPAKGVIATLLLVDADDLSRDILKSDTAGIEIPDLDLTLNQGTLGGVYTSIEGLLTKIKSNLSAADPFAYGDSADNQKRTSMDAFLDSFDRLVKGESFPLTLILTDPLANSFIGPRRSMLSPATPLDTHDENQDRPHQDDPLLFVSEYARSWEEDEELGLHDIDTGDDGALPPIDEHPAQPDHNMVDHPNPAFARGCDDNLAVPSMSS